MTHDDDIYDPDDPDLTDPRPQWSREVTFLNCQPCHADTPLTGEPVAVVTLECKGEIESPLLFNLTDARRLVVGLLGALDYFDDRVAGAVLPIYYGGDATDADPPEVPQPWQPSEAPDLGLPDPTPPPANPHQVHLPDDMLMHMINGRCCACNRPYTSDDLMVLHVRRCKEDGFPTPGWYLFHRMACPRCGRQEVSGDLLRSSQHKRR